jgi:hypothetical protein
LGTCILSNLKFLFMFPDHSGYVSH